MSDRFQCLQCDHEFIVVQPPQPWHGAGFDADMNPIPGDPEEATRKGIPPNTPINPDCPRCGHLYVKRAA